MHAVDADDAGPWGRPTSNCRRLLAIVMRWAVAGGFVCDGYCGN